MLGAERRVELATLRINLRAVNAEIEAIRRESRRYRQMHFGLDIKEIQLNGLQDQRETLAAQVGNLELFLQLRPPRQHHALAWLLLPLGIVLRLRTLLAPVEDLSAGLDKVVRLPVGQKERSYGRERMVAGARYGG